MIDLAAGGIFAAMFGDNAPEIWNRIFEMGNHSGMKFCSYSPHRQNHWRDKYIGMLKDLTGFESVALFSTGSEACEAFWRCVRVYTGKPGIWGGLIDPDEVGTDHPRCDAMHGMTLGSMLMAGRLTWPELGIFPELGGDWGGKFGLVPGLTAGMIMEPFHAPSAQWHKFNPTIKRIMVLQKEFPDIPLCMDEIQGGFGRTGKLWAYEHYDNSIEEETLLSPDGGENIVTKTIIDKPLKPQFITIGKLCGGGLPLSALLGPKEIMEADSVKSDGHLHSTHSGNPLMCAVGCAVIDEMQKQNLIKESERKGVMLHDALKTFPVRTHGKGLLAGLEMADAGEVAAVVGKCQARDVLVVDTGRKWVKMGPQLNIEDDDLMKGVGILREAVEEIVYARVHLEGDKERNSDEPTMGEAIRKKGPL